VNDLSDNAKHWLQRIGDFVPTTNPKAREMEGGLPENWKNYIGHHHFGVSPAFQLTRLDSEDFYMMSEAFEEVSMWLHIRGINAQ